MEGLDLCYMVTQIEACLSVGWLIGESVSQLVTRLYITGILDSGHTDKTEMCVFIALTHRSM